MASKAGKLRLFKLTSDGTTSLLHEFDRLSKPILDITHHPRIDAYCIAGCSDSMIRVYDLRRCEVIYTF